MADRALIALGVPHRPPRPPDPPRETFTLAQVLAELAQGKTFCCGGGRSNYTFSWVDGKINRHLFDEGTNLDEFVDEKELAESIAASDFRRA